MNLKKFEKEVSKMWSESEKKKLKVKMQSQLGGWIAKMLKTNGELVSVGMGSTILEANKDLVRNYCSVFY